jgi:hypothetical protein
MKICLGLIAEVFMAVMFHVIPFPVTKLEINTSGNSKTQAPVKHKLHVT